MRERERESRVEIYASQKITASENHLKQLLYFCTCLQDCSLQNRGKALRTAAGATRNSSFSMRFQ